jgi:hypothetical protein
VRLDPNPQNIASFELGIKLGALYHQFIGMPINTDMADDVEKVIEKSVMNQPYVKDVKVLIDRDKILENLNKFGYSTLRGDMLYVKITVEYEGWRATGVMEYDEDINYPIMKLVSLEEI